MMNTSDDITPIPRLPPLIATGNSKVGYYVATYQNKWCSEKKRSIRIGSSAVGRIQGKKKYGRIEFYEEFLEEYPELKHFYVYRTNGAQRYVLVPKKPKEVVADPEPETTEENSRIPDQLLTDAARELLAQSKAEAQKTAPAKSLLAACTSKASQREEEVDTASNEDFEEENWEELTEEETALFAKRKRVKSDGSSPRRRGRPCLCLQLPPLVLMGSAEHGFYLATYQNRWSTERQRSVRVNSTTVGRIRDKRKFGLVDFYKSFVELYPALRRYDIYRIQGGERYIILPKRKRIQARVAVATTNAEMIEILHQLQIEEDVKAKLKLAAQGRPRIAEAVKQIRTHKRSSKVDTSNMQFSEAMEAIQAAVQDDDKADRLLTAPRPSRKKCDILPPLLAVANHKYGYYYIMTYKNKWNPSLKRSLRVRTISVGRIKGERFFGLILFKDIFYEMYPKLKKFDIYRVGGKQHYMLVLKRQRIQRLAELARNEVELEEILTPFVDEALQFIEESAKKNLSPETTPQKSRD